MECPLCGHYLIKYFSELVCPACGCVVSYDFRPSVVERKFYSPLSKEYTSTLPKELVDKIHEKFKRDFKELSRYDKVFAEEVVRALESIVYGVEEEVSWDALRVALEIARKYRLPVDKVVEIRRKRVEKELEKLAKVLEEENVPVSRDELLKYAYKHKEMWSGRKAKTVAYMIAGLLMIRKGLEEKAKKILPPKIYRLVKTVAPCVRNGK